jgi:hypothetical protein
VTKCSQKELKIKETKNGLSQIFYLEMFSILLFWRDFHHQSIFILGNQHKFLDFLIPNEPILRKKVMPLRRAISDFKEIPPSPRPNVENRTNS